MDSGASPDSGTVAGGDAGSDGGAGLCGNGQLDPGEFCDPSVASPLLGTCPTTCDTYDVCLSATLVSAGCNTHCAITRVTACQDNDGCCPPGCTSANDNDCTGTSCAVALWPQYRGNALHEGGGTSPLFDDATCVPWAQASAPPAILWQRNFGGAIWNSPAYSPSSWTDGGFALDLAVGGSKDAGALVYHVDLGTGSSQLSWTSVADARLAGPGLLTDDDICGIVLSSPNGGLTLGGAVTPQLVQSYPNAVVYYDPSGPTWWLAYIGADGYGHADACGGPTQSWTATGPVNHPDQRYRVAASSDLQLEFLGFDSPYFDTLSGAPGTTPLGSDGFNFEVYGVPAVGLPAAAYALNTAGDLYDLQAIPPYPLQPVRLQHVGVPFTSPVFDRSGRVYVGANGNQLLAFGFDLYPLWTLTLPAGFDDPAALSDGTVLLGGHDGVLYDIRDGAIAWQVALTGSLGSPIVGPNGTIVVASSDGTVTALGTPLAGFPIQPGPPYGDAPATVWYESPGVANSTRDQYTYDSLGRIVSKSRQVFDATGAPISLSREDVVHDGGELSELVDSLHLADGGWEVTGHSYFRWSGPQLQEIDTDLVQGDGGTTVGDRFVYSYDAAGELTNEADQFLDNGSWTTQYAWNFGSYSTNGLVGTDNEGSPPNFNSVEILFSYDLGGRLISQQHIDCNVTESYDASGRIREEQVWCPDSTGAQFVETSRRRFAFDPGGGLSATYSEDALADGGWNLTDQVLLTRTDAGSSADFDQMDPRPIRQWALDWYGYGQFNRYAR